MSKSTKTRVLIVCGTTENWLHPVPPVADSAPEWNIFRLADMSNQIEIHVVSPCAQSQLASLRCFPRQNSNYHHVVFPDWYLSFYRTVLTYFLPLRLAVRRLMQLPDLTSWLYLRRVIPLIKEIKPDLLFINARPQYIRYLRSHVSPGRLLLFVRGPMGESHRFLHLWDGHIVNSTGIGEYIRQLLGSQHVPLYTVPNSLGEEFKTPSPPDNRFQQTPKKILFAGRIIPEKGVLELLEAFFIVHALRPDTQLLIYGASDNYKVDDNLTPYEHRIRAYATRLPVEAVRFCGYIPNKEMGKHYVEATVAVFPSIFLESFGMVALEAMRCGTPVVASRRPGFTELVIEGKTGILVNDPQNAQELANAILTIIDSPDIAQKMGIAGYLHSLNYTPESASLAFTEVVNIASANAQKR